MSMTPEERRAHRAEYQRRYKEANKEKLMEQYRRYREANKEKVDESKLRWREANRDKEAERLKHRGRNLAKESERGRQYREANRDKMKEKYRRRHRRQSFAEEDGSSFQLWMASLARPKKAIEVIANLQPDPGQTLAELIHELSGYAMEVCEQIANPPVIEDSPALTPPAAPDLF